MQVLLESIGLYWKNFQPFNPLACLHPLKRKTFDVNGTVLILQNDNRITRVSSHGPIHQRELFWLERSSTRYKVLLESWCGVCMDVHMCI